MSNLGLIPLRRADLEIGKPLRWSVYDENGVLLLAQGFVLDSEHKLSVLFSKGLYRVPRQKTARHDRLEEHSADASSNTYIYVHDRDKSRMLHPVARLPIGISVSLQGNKDLNDERYVCRYIGYEPEKSVLVSNPVFDGALLPCHDGQIFNVRCFHGRLALAFKARVSKAHLNPYPYLHLAFPKEVKAVKVRKSYRADVDIIAMVESGKDKVPSRIENLGVGGARLITHRRLGPVGSAGYISFRVTVEEHNAFIKAPITIRSQATEIENGQDIHIYGIQFGELEQAHKCLILNLVYRASVEEGL